MLMSVAVLMWLDLCVCFYGQITDHRNKEYNYSTNLSLPCGLKIDVDILLLKICPFS